LTTGYICYIIYITKQHKEIKKMQIEGLNIIDRYKETQQEIIFKGYTKNDEEIYGYGYNPSVFVKSADTNKKCRFYVLTEKNEIVHPSFYNKNLTENKLAKEVEKNIFEQIKKEKSEKNLMAELERRISDTVREARIKFLECNNTLENSLFCILENGKMIRVWNFQLETLKKMYKISMTNGEEIK
jgi:tRNA G18 (ribose-2'-O)-methylase SpoU